MSRYLVGILLFGILSITSSSYAGNTKLAVYYIPLPPLISQDGKQGALVQAVKELERRSNVQLDLKHLTTARIVRKIDRHERVAVLPVLHSSARRIFASTVYLSAPIGFRISQIYTRVGDAPFEVIEPRKVFVTAPSASLPFPLQEQKGLNILRTHSLASALHILSRGRADILVNDITVTDHALAHSRIDNVFRHAQGPKFIQPAHIVFSSAVNSRVRGRINIAILSMVADGSLKRLLPQNFVDDYVAFQSAGVTEE